MLILFLNHWFWIPPSIKGFTILKVSDDGGYPPETLDMIKHPPHCVTQKILSIWITVEMYTPSTIISIWFFKHYQGGGLVNFFTLTIVQKLILTSQLYYIHWKRCSNYNFLVHRVLDR